MLSFLEWFGALTGVIGATLVAMNVPASRWAFVVYLVSNGCWAGFALLSGAWGLLLMQVVFTATSVLGIYRWWFPTPAARGGYQTASRAG